MDLNNDNAQFVTQFYLDQTWHENENTEDNSSFTSEIKNKDERKA